MKNRKEEKYIEKLLYGNNKDYCKAIIDFIAGMTDNFAIDVYNEIIRF